MPLNNPVFDLLHIDRAEGSYLYTPEGKKILDASAGAVVGNIGWGRKEVVTAVAESLEKLTYTLPPFATGERLELAERLARDWLPGGMTGISFFGSGSEANEAAMRIARQYQIAKGRHSRWKVIGRDVSYNGTTLATLGVGGHDARRRGFKPMMTDMPHIAACYCLRCPFDKSFPACEIACASDLLATIEKEGPDTIAGFLAEPVTGTSGGAIVPPEGYWSIISDICKRFDIVLITDEVLTGFGRTGKRMASELWGIEPDVTVLGKGMGGGYAAISAVATRPHIQDALTSAGIAPMYHTYSGHPSQCAAANKVLEIIDREKLVQRVAALGPVLGQKLSVLRNNRYVADVRGIGFLYAIEIVRDKETLELFDAADSVSFKVLEESLKRGVLTYFGGTGSVRDIVIVAPTFVLEESEMDTIVTALDQSIDAVCDRVVSTS